jgi:enoyl-[acyl-carrier protein] reductase I
MGSLSGKRALVFGVANERSIAWAIARALRREGANLALTYFGEALERRVRPLAAEIGAELVLPCDVGDDRQIESSFAEVASAWNGLDVLIHAIAFANREDLARPFVETDREGFRLALDVSAYSLVALTRAALPLMRQAGGGSVITLTFAGSERVFPNYNVMGVAKAALEACVRYLAADLGRDQVRVNAISAGPIKTLSAAGIRNFREMLHVAEQRAPLGRNVSAEEVAEVALLLAGASGAAITGQVIFADAGLCIMGV